MVSTSTASSSSVLTSPTAVHRTKPAYEADQDDETDRSDLSSDHGSESSPVAPKKRWIRKEKIGQGAQGSVYRCEEVATGNEVAAKVILTHNLSNAEIEAIKREVKIIKRLQHRHLVQYLKATEKKHKLSIYMEYVGGGSLSAKLRRDGALPLDSIKRYTRQLLSALQFLHENRIAHRDIKCANIFLTASEKHIKLGDFGAFKEMGCVSLVGGLKGTPHWMAPEVIREQQTSADGWIKADIWSLGCTILEMLTGHSPWRQYSNPMTAMYQIVSSNNIPTIPANATDETASFLQWCLQRNPDDRPDTTQLLSHPFVCERKASPKKKSTASRRKSSVGRIENQDEKHGAEEKTEKKERENEAVCPSKCDEKDRERGANKKDMDKLVQDLRFQKKVEDKGAQEEKTILSPTLKADEKHPTLTKAEDKDPSRRPSLIPRLKPLEPRRVTTNQVASADDPVPPSISRGSSLGLLTQLPRLDKKVRSIPQATTRSGSSIASVRLRRISTAPTPATRIQDDDLESYDKFKLPPLSARAPRSTPASFSPDHKQ